MIRRRHWLKLMLGAGIAPAFPARLLAAAPEFPAVVPRPLKFPRDHGAHPEFRTEWWYATGWLDVAGEAVGFQVTFFRSRSSHDPANPSRFAPHQLLFAHVALARPGDGKLHHDQRAARVVRGDASASFALDDTDLCLQSWRFQRLREGAYRVAIDGEAVNLSLTLTPTQPLLLQGEDGFSRKGAQPDQASYYYSQPQLAVGGHITLGGQPREVTGRAWLDHEWSSRVLDDEAAGWDWIGINLDDGGALMVFRIRSRTGNTVRWASARWRQADGRERSYGPGEVDFETVASWRSPRTGATYPVRSRLKVGVGRTAASFEIEPLMEDQELDARQSTGAVYWEGAVRLLTDGQPVGRGYLELVGYHRPMSL